MKNSKNKNSVQPKNFFKGAKKLSDEEIKSVSGGMKVATEEDQSWIKTVVDFFFKVNN